ncbi:MAG TPA: hypothetical protein VFE54_13285, partial [Mucilaginibacter sp.]|nr:hypothetical protein [Mucilaginibacter sp.]
KASNNDILVGQWPCESNYPVIYTIKTLNSYNYEFELFFPEKLDKNYKISVGMFLCKYSNIEDNETFSYDMIHNKWQQSCLIWSNEITIPKP